MRKAVQDKAYSEALSWLQPICEGFAARLKNNDFPKVSPSEMIYERSLGIELRNGSYLIDEMQAHELVLKSKADGGAYDLLRKVAAQNILAGASLPRSIWLFVAGVLIEDRGAVRPKYVKRDTTWLKNMYLYALVTRCSQLFDLSPTRNDATEKISACDVVVHALDDAGYGVNYRLLKALCVEKSYKGFRDEAALLRKHMNLSAEQLVEQYDVPEHFFERVNDEQANSDTTEG